MESPIISIVLFLLPLLVVAVRKKIGYSFLSSLSFLCMFPSLASLHFSFVTIIRYFFNVYKKFKIYTDIYEIQLHFQKITRANTNWIAGHIWPAGRSLDTPAVDPRVILLIYKC